MHNHFYTVDIEASDWLRLVWPESHETPDRNISWSCRAVIQRLKGGKKKLFVLIREGL